MTREIYLKSLWRPYPKALKDDIKNELIKSRWSDPIADGILGEFTQQGEFITHGFKASDILVLGDIVLMKEHHIQLLAPNIGQKSLEQINKEKNHLLKWNGFLKSLRKFFETSGFLEIQTPTLVPSSGSETFLRPFTSNGYCLPTSPEFHLKRALVLGIENAFEIRSCFRQEENTPQHAAEFTMLEWYRSFAGIDAIQKDVYDLFKYVNDNIEGAIRFDGSITLKSMAEVFREYLNFDLTPQTSREELKKLAIDRRTHFDPSDSWNDLFHRLFIEHVEPRLGLVTPLILKDFPPSQSALARLNEKGWADRFEVYFRGFEIANAYDELNDPIENSKRFLTWQKEKRDLGSFVPPVDDGLIEALRLGMPTSGGIALGVDRLFMAFFGIKDIREIPVFRD